MAGEMPHADRTGPTINFEGRMLGFDEGDSLLATLVKHGAVAQGTRSNGRPRGGYCGIGVCHDCLVVVDGKIGLRACTTSASSGMKVIRQHDPPALQEARGPMPHGGVPATPQDEIVQERIDALIVGAGPAGLAAATELARNGVPVILLDEREPGGQDLRRLIATSGRVCGPDRHARETAAVVAEARRAGVVIRERSMVWGAFREEGALVLGVYRNGRASYIRPRQLIIATGAVARASLLPGWTLPGVITTGGCRTLLRSLGQDPGRRIVVAGTGPLNLQLASELIEAGAKLLAVVEAAPAPWRRPAAAARLLMAGAGQAWTGLSHLAALRQAGVTMLWEHRLVAVEGRQKAERAVIADRHGKRRDFSVDIVCVGEGYMPANELARLLGCAHRVTAGPLPGLVVEQDDAGATSQPDVFVIGAAAAPGSVGIARAQGELAALEASRRLGRRSLTPRSTLARLRRHERFQRASCRLFAAPEPGLTRATGETIICRCEGISLDALRRQVAARSIVDVATLKRLTRAGMGRCQGRYCEPCLAALVGGVAQEADFLAPQVPLRPLPVAAIGVEKPEWRAHARTPLPRSSAPALRSGSATNEAEIVVIGGGIVGLCTALFLARSGNDVVVIERGRSNAMASGGNAGSLHAQLLSFDHDDRDGMAISAAARTLPLQRDAIALWRVLERELDTNFEMKLTGGLMVAGTGQDLAFLASKIRVEQRQGIACELIDADALRALEPALHPGLLGASYCPTEGKINPLVASDAIAGAVEQAGGRIMPMTGVRAIERRDAGFWLETTNGTWRAGKVVNAAGAFAGAVGTMLGVSVPVFAAPLQMIVTEPVAPLLECLVAHAGRHLTLKQTTNGAILIGGGWTAGLDPVHLHPRPLRRSLEGNLWAAQHVLPALGAAHVVRSWAAMNIDIDGAPILGEHPAVPGFFNAVTSNGYTLAPIIGRITCELMMHAETDRDVAGFSVTRFDA